MQIPVIGELVSFIDDDDDVKSVVTSSLFTVSLVFC